MPPLIGKKDYLFDALKAGASGFVLKTSNADDLVEAIRKVACGLGLLASEMTLPIIKRLVHPDTEPVTTEAELSSGDRLMLESLTARERETLEPLADELRQQGAPRFCFVADQDAGWLRDLPQVAEGRIRVLDEGSHVEITSISEDGGSNLAFLVV